MMKADRVFLHNWQGDDADEYVDIPWPLVHKIAGTELVNWLNSRDHTEAQMILEKTSNGWQTLWAEFYEPKVRSEFALRFAK